MVYTLIQKIADLSDFQQTVLDHLHKGITKIIDEKLVEGKTAE